MNNDLLERYLYDIGRRLPAGQRDDILKELRSALLDALEERGGQLTAKDMVEVIRQFGRPADVAAKYTGERSLVGPALLPTYWLVLKIALAATALATGIGAAFDLPALQPTTSVVTQWLGRVIGDLFASGLSAVGSVTLIFAVLERVNTAKSIASLSSDWNPSELPPVPAHHEERKTGGAIATIVFSVLVLIVFHQYPEAVGFYHTDGNGLQAFPLFSSEALAAYLPLWTVGWALTIVLCAVELAQRGATVLTRIADTVLQAYWACVLVFMLIGPTLLSDEVTAVFKEVAGDVGFMQIFLTQQFRWALGIALVGTVYGIVRNIVRMVWRRN